MLCAGQIVLAGSQTYWTSEVEEALNRGGSKAVKEYYDTLLNQLEGLTKLVRTAFSQGGEEVEVDRPN